MQLASFTLSKKSEKYLGLATMKGPRINLLLKSGLYYMVL